MRTRRFAWLTVVLAGCSLALDPSRFVGGGRDGGGDAAGIDAGLTCMPGIPCMATGAPAQQCCNARTCELRAGAQTFPCAGTNCDAAGMALGMFCSMPLVDGGPPVDGGCGACTTGMYCGPGGTCVGCDADGDTFISTIAACDAAAGDAPRDCDDGNPAVHPGAPTICGDGVENDCLRGAPWDTLFGALGVQEVGALVPGDVAPGGLTNLDQLSVSAMYGPSAAMTGPDEARAVVGFTSGPVGTVAATLVTARLDPSVSTIAMFPVAPSDVVMFDSRRVDPSTVDFALIAGAVPVVQWGKYAPFDVGAVPTVTGGSTSVPPYNGGSALGGGFNAGSGTSVPLLYYVHTSGGGATTFDVASTSAATVGTMISAAAGAGFTDGTPVFGSSGFVVGEGAAGATVLATIAEVNSVPFAGSPGVRVGRAAFALTAPPAEGLLVLGTPRLHDTGPVGLDLVPVSCRDLATCVGGLDSTATIEVVTGTVMPPQLLSATEFPTPAGSAVVIAGVDQTTTGTRIRVRTVGGAGVPLAPLDLPFELGLGTSPGDVSMIRDVRVGAAVRSDLAEGVIVVAVSYVDGSSNEHIAVTGLRSCAAR